MPSNCSAKGEIEAARAAYEATEESTVKDVVYGISAYMNQVPMA